MLAVGVALLAMGPCCSRWSSSGRSRWPAPPNVTAPWLAAAFLACELFGIWVERKEGEFYGFTLALVPLAVGLVYADPSELVLARMAGVA